MHFAGLCLICRAMVLPCCPDQVLVGLVGFLVTAASYAGVFCDYVLTFVLRTAIDGSETAGIVSA